MCSPARVGDVVGGDVDRLHRCDRAGARRGSRHCPSRSPGSAGSRRRSACDRAARTSSRLHEAEDVVDEEQDGTGPGRGSTRPSSTPKGRRAGAHLAARSSARRRARPCRSPDSVISSQRSLPSRVRSPTPANTETPPCCMATLWISSWIRTVLPRPAPPKAILPPRTNGATRSTTFMPVSKISIVGDSSWNGGGSRWIAQRSPASFSPLPSLARRAARRCCDVPEVTEGRVPDRHGDRVAGVDGVDPARETVGGVHRNRADAIVTEVLLHFRDQRSAAWHADAQRVVDLGQLARENGVDHDALDLDDRADVPVSLLGHPLSCLEVLRRTKLPTAASRTLPESVRSGQGELLLDKLALAVAVAPPVVGGERRPVGNDPVRGRRLRPLRVDRRHVVEVDWPGDAEQQHGGCGDSRGGRPLGGRATRRRGVSGCSSWTSGSERRAFAVAAAPWWNSRHAGRRVQVRRERASG